jgi:hypothetical protein
MANNLVSPGVDVRIIDESFYATAGAGTVPLIVIATHKNKQHPSGIGIAEGTLEQNAGKLYLLSSQREAVQTFGYPKFYYDEIGTPLHGYELNEYGLHTIHQYLAAANRVYTINAPIDLSQLLPTRYAPRGVATAGTFWLDTKETSFGIFSSDGGSVPGVAWQSKSTRVIDTVSEVERVLLGTVQVSDSAIDVIITGSSNIVINGTSITLSGPLTLDQVVEAINQKNITSIHAISFRNAGKSSLMIKNINGGDIDLSESTDTTFTSLGVSSASYLTPKSTIGSLGDFAIVTLGRDNVVYQKLLPQDFNGYPDTQASAHYFIVGSTAWKMATPTVAIGTGFNAASIATTDSIRINGSTPIVIGSSTKISDIVILINTAGIQNIIASELSTTQLRITNTSGGDIILENASGTPLTALGMASVNGNRMFYSSHTQYPTGSVAGDVWIKTTEFNAGAKWVIKVFSQVTGRWTLVNAPLVGNTTPIGSETQGQADDRKATSIFGSTIMVGVVYIRYNLYGSSGSPVASHEIRRYNGSSWETLVYEAGTSQPTTLPEDGTYWYNENFKVDIMINLNGSKWVGYRKHPSCSFTDTQGPFLQSSAPTIHRDGTALKQHDLWIDTSDLENYPAIYRYNESTRKWIKIDNTDQTSPMGIVFDDVRENSGPRLNASTDTYTSYSEDMLDMLQSDFVDPDCVDPRLYPDGTLLFNLRYSTLNVKEYKSNYFGGDFDGYDYSVDSYSVGDTTIPQLETVGRWVTVSGLKTDGTPYMWRKAQRAMIVRSLQEAIMSNEDVRAETIFFNLITCPGYIEATEELIQLNTDKKEVGFILADPPVRLKPVSQSIQNWVVPLGEEQTLANTEEKLGTNNPYVGVYYPWGLSSNYDGREVMVPPSTMILRVLAYNDSIAYPWYAPAGYNRGLVNNATTVGYLTSENEFKPVILNQGQRDILYLNKINPIAYIPNRGLVVYGQKTLYGMDSALDRVNVIRLINYLRYNTDNMAKQFLFEPNVKHTRDTVRITFERFLSDLIATNAIYDFVVVCDESNNTPPRIDRNELWIDIAIQPVKAIEFIIIPIRVRNTGEDMSIV